MPSLTVEKIYKERKELLDLTLLAGFEGLGRQIESNEIFRPGLALAGFTERFSAKRIQVLGETEMTYLSSLTPKQRTESVERIVSFPIPVLVATKGIVPETEIIEVANRTQTPLLSTRLTTTEFIGRLATILDNIFAPSITKHGTLVDVYGVGLLYTGKSGDR